MKCLCSMKLSAFPWFSSENQQEEENHDCEEEYRGSDDELAVAYACEPGEWKQCD